MRLVQSILYRSCTRHIICASMLILFEPIVPQNNNTIKILSVLSVERIFFRPARTKTTSTYGSARARPICYFVNHPRLDLARGTPGVKEGQVRSSKWSIVNLKGWRGYIDSLIIRSNQRNKTTNKKQKDALFLSPTLYWFNRSSKERVSSKSLQQKTTRRQSSIWLEMMMNQLQNSLTLQRIRKFLTFAHLLSFLLHAVPPAVRHLRLCLGGCLNISMVLMIPWTMIPQTVTFLPLEQADVKDYHIPNWVGP